MILSSSKLFTVVVMTSSLLQPLPGFAQTEVPKDVMCADGAEPPCAEGVRLILPEDVRSVEAVPVEEPVEPVVPGMEPNICYTDGSL